MDKKIRIYVADDNQDFVYLIEECLSAFPEFELAGKAYDGETAVREIVEKDPDVVLLDMVMPKKDGISILEELNCIKKQTKPLVLILTAIGQEKYIKKALSLGAEYYILKPYDLSLLPKRITQIFLESERQLKKADSAGGYKADSIYADSPKNQDVTTRERVEAVVIKILRNIGVSANYSGYSFLVKAVVETVLSDNRYIPLTSELYPMIAKSCNTSMGKVERGIRDVIQKVWHQINSSTLTTYFSKAEICRGARLKNSEFIAIIADKTRLMLSEKQID